MSYTLVSITLLMLLRTDTNLPINHSDPNKDLTLDTSGAPSQRKAGNTGSLRAAGKASRSVPVDIDDLHAPAVTNYEHPLETTKANNGTKSLLVAGKFLQPHQI